MVSRASFGENGGDCFEQAAAERRRRATAGRAVGLRRAMAGESCKDREQEEGAAAQRATVLARIIVSRIVDWQG
jgi:hypothetical protein